MESKVGNRWMAAWPDALAFAGGLAVAWFADWRTADLVWSLWLSSLVVGYLMILWGAFSPAVLKFREGDTGGGALRVIGGLGLVMFFTFHFGLFHLVHAAFLGMFFPVSGGGVPGARPPTPAVFREVLEQYWVFLPIALLAERQAFRLPALPPEPPATSVRASDIASRKARQQVGLAALFLPYKNVIRLHLLIFFFAAAHFLKLDSFLVYAVVYAVYFFPWQLVKQKDPSAD